MILAFVALVFSALVLFPPNSIAAVSASPPYSVTVFAPSFSGQGGADSVAFDMNNIFVGYSAGAAKDGSDHKPSTIVEYDLQGKQVKTFSVIGHNDGLRISPKGDLWALQNEDGNPTLVIIDLDKRQQSDFAFAPTAHGGGFDDIVFDGSSIFITASNPSKNPNTDPAVVSAEVKGESVSVSSVLAGNALATNVLTGASGALNLQDPDSMILDPDGELVFTSQGDMELIVVEHPGQSCQKALLVPLTTPDNDTPMADDTVFARSGQGRILFADKTSNIVYSMTTPYFGPGAAYTAYQDSTGTKGFVGELNLSTGLITPVITGLGNPGGMAFISTEADLNDPKTQPAKMSDCP